MYSPQGSSFFPVLSCFKGLPWPLNEQSYNKFNHGPSDRLPSGEYIRESLSKMNNSTNIVLTPKLLLVVSIKTRRSGLMKKNRHNKFHDTITLKNFSYF